jgi:hypothetical protein
MKKIAFISLIIISVFASCKNKPDYEEEIKGKWLCSEINNLIQPTNEAFVLNFLSNGTESIAQGCTLADNEGNSWCESHDFSYSVNEDEILISGTNSSGELLDISLSIESLTTKKLVYKENYVKVNNVDVSSDRTFILNRCSEDYSNQIIGTWQGKKFFSADSSTNFYFMINYKSDNSFDYYIKVGDSWELADITGTYFLNGELLTMNFLDNSATNNNHSYDCWLVDEVTTDQITCWQYNKMSDSDYNLQGIKYELVKVTQ